MHRLTCSALIALTLLACNPGSSSTTEGDSTSTTTAETTGPTSTGPDASTVTPTTATPETGTSDPTTAGTGTSEATTAGETTAAATTAGETTAVTATGDTGDTGNTGDTGDTAVVGDCDPDDPHVRLSTTMGDMVVRLDPVNAPTTVANFLMYVESGFYDGTIFHRVIDDFVIQGGGFTPDLEQKPTEAPIPLEISPALKHVDGAIAMARTNDPNSATSQFYLCDGPQGFLDGNYAAFGVIVEGFDVLAAIASVATHDEGPFSDVPVRDVIVTSATCVAVP